MEPHMPEPSQADLKQRSYRSPKRVLARSFEISRDGWKKKYKAMQERNEAFRTEVRDLRRSRDKWRAQAEDLQQQLDALRAEARRPIESPPALS
jgi:cell division protein FtsB